MNLLHGTYYDGESSRGDAATLQVSRLQVVLAYADQSIQIDPNSIDIEAALGRMPRKITWQGNEFFAADASIELDQLVGSLGKSSMMDWVAGLEKRVGVIIAATLGTFFFILGFGIYGVPKIAEAAAYILPQGVSAQLATSTLEKLDFALDESALSGERQAQLRAYFLSKGTVDELHFRHAQRMGASAFTLSQTTVVFTDDLVQLTDDDDELLAVYFHELGHARLLHIERSILQSVAWAAVLTMITGDVGGVSELVLALPLTLGQAAYSRKHEREADEFAIAELKALGISPLKLASILDLIEASHSASHADDLASSLGLDAPELEYRDSSDAQDTSATNAGDNLDLAKNENGEIDESHSFSRRLLELLSSHPINSERKAFIRAAAKDN
jgi:Zn-dependent protease with chaperone function